MPSLCHTAANEGQRKADSGRSALRSIFDSVGRIAHQGFVIECGTTVGLSSRRLSAFRVRYVAVAHFVYVRPYQHGCQVAVGARLMGRPLAAAGISSVAARDRCIRIDASGETSTTAALWRVGAEGNYGRRVG